ncbi:enoyl-CoA hydratase/isomerase family protein [Sessilibacter sp. MAH1]
MSSSVQPSVLFEELASSASYKIAIATLNAPKTINALSSDMVSLLLPQLMAWRNDPAIACIVLRGEGDRGFCAGGDVVELRRSSLEDDGKAAQFFANEYRLDYTIHTYPKPIIVWGHGVVMGGGLGLLAGASHRVVTEKTRLAMPEITIGLFPDVGASWFLNRMPGRIGLFLALTGVPINAADTLYVGLADHFLNHEQWEEFVEALVVADWYSQNNFVEVISKILIKLSNTSSNCPKSLLKEHFDQIQELTSGVNLAEIYQTITDYSGDDPWLQSAALTLKNGCPVTAALVPELLHRAKYLSLKEVFQMEWVVAANCMRFKDFAEGVRALLVDKDKTPKFEPSRIQDVSKQIILDHFDDSIFAVNPLSDL